MESWQSLSVRTEVLSPEDIKDIAAAIQLANPYEVAQAAMKISSLRNAIKNVFLNEVDAQCTSLCARKRTQPSVLRVPGEHHKTLVEFCWNDILTEMKERAPDVLDFMVATAVPKLKGNDGRQIMPICTAYGILMNVRCRELSLIQKMNAILLGVGNATKRTFERLNKSCITQSRESFRNIMDSLGSNLTSVIKAKVESGQEMRVVFDNFDFKVLANIILRNHRNSDMHWIAHYVTFDRISSTHLDDSKPIVPNIMDFENANYLMSKSELDQQRNDYIILVARVLVEFFPALKPLQDVIPSHISHRYSSEMAKKSCIVGLPVVPFNQNKISDVCQYLQWLQDLLYKVFKNEDEGPLPDSGANQSQESVLEKVRVPLAGDLLGRERVTGAKKTRLGCDSCVERFENIVECPTLWHAKQSFLCYVWEQLYKATTISGRDVGTLYNLRQHFRLVNVSNKVKKNYKSAENLMLSATQAYLCSAFKIWAGLEKLDGIPVNLPKLPQSSDTTEVKKEYLFTQIGKFVDEFVLVEFDVERAWMEAREESEQSHTRAPSRSGLHAIAGTRSLTADSTAASHSQASPHVETSQAAGNSAEAANQPNPCMEASLAMGQVVVMVQREQEKYGILGVGKVCQISTSHPPHLVPVLVAFVQPEASATFTVGQVVLWPQHLLAVYGERISEEPTHVEPPSPVSSIPTSSTEDRRMNYGLQIMQLGVLLVQLNDTEAEGDGLRSLRNWKLLMLFFRSRSRGMKYAFEAMRFITFVQALYSERMAHRILHGQFINAKGGNGNNYSNDLKMEHEV
ncbi:uncharacterized protein LOC144650183 isoform X2 [Oculina patagonica]